MAKKKWTFGQDRNRCRRAYRSYSLEHDAVRAKLKALEENKPDYQKLMIRPLCREIAKRLDRNWSINGPFGLCCEFLLNFHEKGVPMDSDDPTCITITVTVQNYNGEWTLKLRDYSKQTNDFGPNTLGALNGMNHPSIEIPPEADAEWFIKQLKLDKKLRNVDEPWMQHA